MRERLVFSLSDLLEGPRPWELHTHSMSNSKQERLVVQLTYALKDHVERHSQVDVLRRPVERIRDVWNRRKVSTRCERARCNPQLFAIDETNQERT
jgi:hypothetical protein